MDVGAHWTAKCNGVDKSLVGIEETRTFSDEGLF